MMSDQQEPSVLDYIKARLFFWKKGSADLPDLGEIAASEPDIDPEAKADFALVEAGVVSNVTRAPLWPWRALLGLGFGILAQISLEPGINRIWLPGLILYLASATCVVWSARMGEWNLADHRPQEMRTDIHTVRIIPALVGLFSAALLFLASAGNRFSVVSVTLLLVAIGSLVWAFWPSKKAEARVDDPGLVKDRPQKLPSGWIWFVIGVIVMAIIFRFINFTQTPPEMTSDHAEKILDVMRVLDGQTKIFFPTNGGREALHFYWLAFLHKLLNIEPGFNLLRLSTILIGLLALPFLYGVGLELANHRVGLLATAFAAVAYWPNVISRIGLRFPFYVLFTAVTLYLLLTGLRTQSRRPFILAGITLGLSLYGYSADRVLPLVVLAAVGLYLLHSQSRRQRRQVIWFTVILLLFAIILALPLMRYMVDFPEDFLYRTLSRVGSLERPLDGPVWLIFMRNLGRALTMFFWDNGEVWLASVPYRPALEWATAASFFAGVVLLLVRYVRSRHWLDIFLLISIPLLMLPSIMALAFPDENPNLYRTGGALVPVFVILALAVDGLMSSVQERFRQPHGTRLAWAAALLLVAMTALQGYNLVSDTYVQQYRLSVWNTSEMGRLMRTFADLTGTTDNAWIIPYPHWVDTRLVGMNAGFPSKDYALFLEQLDSSRTVLGAKMFLLKPEDQPAAMALRTMYPQGWFQEYESAVPTKNFLAFMVPPQELSVEPETP